MANPAKMPAREAIAHIDGASRGNPGPAAYAVVMEPGGGAPPIRLTRLLGETTNNVAEYQALLAALEYAVSHELDRLRVRTDSELLARQITGQYKVKHPALKPLHEQARRLIERLGGFSIEHVPREQNREADRLANRTLDGAGSGGSASDLPARTAPALLRISATYQKGALKLHQGLPLEEGEEVEVEIRRKEH